MATIKIKPLYGQNQTAHRLNMLVLKRHMDRYELEILYMKRLENGVILVRTTDFPDEEFMETTVINEVQVEIDIPWQLNLIKGRIYHPELVYMDAKDTKHLLADAGENFYSVIKYPGKNYADIKWKSEMTRELPHSVLLGWDRVRVKPLQAQPLRCFCCQAYGHKAAACTKTPVCPVCSGDHEPTRKCNLQPKCPACSGPHSAFDPECPVWLEEKEVAKIKKKENLSYRDALKKRQEQKKEEEEEEPSEEEEEEEDQQEDEEDDTDQQQQQEESNKRKTTDEEQQQVTKKDKKEEAQGQTGTTTNLPGDWQQATSRKKKKTISKTSDFS